MRWTTPANGSSWNKHNCGCGWILWLASVWRATVAGYCGWLLWLAILWLVMLWLAILWLAILWLAILWLATVAGFTVTGYTVAGQESTTMFFCLFIIAGWNPGSPSY